MGRVRYRRSVVLVVSVLAVLSGVAVGAEREWWRPYSPPCVERENVFEFTEKPTVRFVGKDRYEITFAVASKGGSPDGGYCDVTVAIVDPEKDGSGLGRGTVVRHLASGVLGPNAPAPFQKNSLRQTIYWNGKDDLDNYVKEPEKLVVRVSVGLKPEFEKPLGGSSPHNVPGIIWGLAAGPDGVYVLSVSSHFGRCYIRVFGHDGSYLRSLIPPPANLPESKLAGWGYVEYEPGKKSVQARNARGTLNSHGEYLCFRTTRPEDCQPVIVGNRLYFADAGKVLKAEQTSVHYIMTDGSSDVPGLAGRPLTWPITPAGTPRPRLAASPDGKWLYLATGPGGRSGGNTAPMVFRAKLDETGMAEPFLGKLDERKNGKRVIELGSDNTSFQVASGIACDAAGRIYVADELNNRIQVYSPEGRHLKTVAMDRPQLVQVHQKTGAIYVLHVARDKGESVNRLTKLTSFDNPKQEYHVDGVSAAAFAVDSWTEKPRLWMAGGRHGPRLELVKSVEVYEEAGGTCRKILDFDEMAAKADGAQYLGRWPGHAGKVVCDVVRNRLYYGSAAKNFPVPAVVDLATGEHLADLRLDVVDDIAFDKKGYMHCHFNPMFFMPGVGRLDPGQPQRARFNREPSSWRYVPGRPYVIYSEIPYDYGVQPDYAPPSVGMAFAGTSHFGSVGGDRTAWRGILPVKDQGGAKAFQDGIGVNMRGDVAEQCNIYHVPKMEDAAYSYAMQGSANLTESGTYNEEAHMYTAFLRSIEEMRKRGEETYFIRRRPGVPLAGGTIWTFEYTGELREPCAVNAGDLINGVQIDEDGDLYFVNAAVRVISGTPFLMNRGGIFGDPEGAKARWNVNPLTGTLIKSRGKDAHKLLASAAVAMPQMPDRPHELVQTDWPEGVDKAENRAWFEGARWFYAGASPIVFSGCSCPTLRFHTDWFKRTFVPEAYRHSIGVLDTNGNLIMHIGRYGNLDSAFGPKSRIPLGGDGIGIIFVRFIGGTDDRLVFDNHGEQIVCLKLNYHVEETIGIPGQVTGISDHRHTGTAK